MAQSDVISQMQGFKAALLAREAQQMELMAQRWLQLEGRLIDAIELLARQMAEQKANGVAVTQGQLFRLGRYQALLAQIATEWGNYADFAEAQIVAGQGRFAALAVDHAVQLMETQAPGIAATFVRLPREAFEMGVGLLGDGSPLRSLLLNAATQAGAVDGLTSTLLANTALGINPRKTARAMADKLAGGLNQALTIARSEQLRIYRETSRQQWQQSGLVEGYYRLATRDDRTCPACLARDGEFIPLGVAMAEHPNGRCGQVPKVAGVAAPQWLKGPEWFKQLPAASQREMLGRARFDAYLNGDFAFSDLATVQTGGQWGGTIQVTPVRELVG